MGGARGKLYGLGIGPGDPELVTLKALRVLREVPVIAYPAPEEGDSFARSVVAGWIAGHQREIAIRFAMRPGPPPEATYDEAAMLLAAELDGGRDIACLCQGDALFYGSFIGLLTRLAERYRVEIVPGVSSLTACAAAAGVPLVSGAESLLVVPATLDEDVLAARLAGIEAGAIVKLGRHVAKVRRVLQRLGLLDAAIQVERATLPSARIVPLAHSDREAAPYFSTVLVRRRAIGGLDQPGELGTSRTRA